MLRVYSTNQSFYVVEDLNRFVLDNKVVWIDLFNPTIEEEHYLEERLGLGLPTREEMKELEISSRLYQENSASYMTANLVNNAETDAPETTNVSFILCQNKLITIRYADLRSFSAFQSYADKHKHVCRNGATTFVALLEAIVDRNAEILEKAGTRVDETSKAVFMRRTNPRQLQKNINLEEVLKDIAYDQNLVAKIRDSLVSMGRLVSFLPFSHEIENNIELRSHLATVSRDIQALSEHASFVTTNVSFLLDASLGLINIEQNGIIKIFSIVSVVLLPPTLIASIYGMNFEFMPELHWRLGYPFSLALMVISAVLPYLWFKRRRWL